MSELDLPAIREAIAEALDDGIDGFQISPYPLSNPTSPALEVGRRSPVTFDKAFNRGLHEVELVVRALISFASPDVEAQRRLDSLVTDDDNSVKELLEADRTLGGTVQSVHVSSVSGDQIFDRGGTRFIGCEWSVRIFVSN